MTHFAITAAELERAEDELFATDEAYQPGLDRVVRAGKHFAALTAPALSIAASHGPLLAIRCAALSCYVSGLTVGMQIAANRAKESQ